MRKMDMYDTNLHFNFIVDFVTIKQNERMSFLS